MNIDQPTKTPATFTVKFWGVRGQVPTPGEETHRFGGNTPCLEIQAGKQRLIFDGGTGLRILGNQLLREMPVEAHLFFTHANWDRIQGFPFFVPAFIPGNHFHIYGTNSIAGNSMEEELSMQMHGPNFPVPIQVMGSKLDFHPLAAEEIFSLGELEIQTAFVHSEHQALGFRISQNGHSIVHATDSDIQRQDNRLALKHLAKDTDLLILNAPKTSKTDNPLQSWKAILEFTKEIGVKQVLFSGHDPDYHDPHLEQLEQTLQSHHPGLEFAKEGEIIEISA